MTFVHSGESLTLASRGEKEEAISVTHSTRAEERRLLHVLEQLEAKGLIVATESD